MGGECHKRRWGIDPTLLKQNNLCEIPNTHIEHLNKSKLQWTVKCPKEKQKQETLQESTEEEDLDDEGDLVGGGQKPEGRQKSASLSLTTIRQGPQCVGH